MKKIYYKIRWLLRYCHSFIQRKATPEQQEAMFPLNSQGGFLEFLHFPQKDLPKVIRWKKYVKEDPRVSKQNGLQHSFCLPIHIERIVFHLQKMNFNKPIDSFLLFSTAIYHDWGEPGVNGDTILFEKTASKDVGEYLSFCELIDKTVHDQDRRVFLKKIFLLQFCVDSQTLRKSPNIELFPSDAQETLHWLYENHRLEALLFMFIEYYDYFFHPLTNFRQNGVAKKSLKSVCFHNPPVLDRIVAEIPELGQKFWTPELRRNAKTYLEKHPDIDINTWEF